MIRHSADAPVTEFPEGVERRLLNRGGALMRVEFRFQDSTPSPPHAHLHLCPDYCLHIRRLGASARR